MQLAQRLPVAYRSRRFTNVFKTQSSLLHWPSLSSKTVVPPPNDTPFFGRDQELRNLHELCSGVPTSISLILGPANSGKTRLLEHFVKSANSIPPAQETISPSSTPAAPQPCSSRSHINARVVSVSTPHAMARALQEHSMPAIVQQLEVLGPFMKEGAQLASAVSGFVATMQARLKDNAGAGLSSNALSAALETFLLDKAELELTEVLAAYHKVLDEYHTDRAKRQSELAELLDKQQQQQQQQQQRGPEGVGVSSQQGGVGVTYDMPVLILDEANVLMQWSNDHPQDLAALLRFFISVTKEHNRSHVILATSDSSFHAWLSQEIGPSFFQSFVVGDFDKGDARQFLDLQLARQQRQPVEDDDWELVQQVCGGNAGALCTAACAYRVLGAWPPALQHVTKDIAGMLWWGLFPGPTAGYSAADYATAVRLLLSSPYGAVDQVVVLSQLPGGLPALQALIRANLLALRLFSDWTTDIPSAAFGPGQHCMLVTAPSPAHRYLMKVEDQKLLIPLQEHQQPSALKQEPAPPWGGTIQPGGTTSTGSSRDAGVSNLIIKQSGSQSNTITDWQQELGRVRAAIADITTELSGVQAELQAVRAAGAEGWQGEAAALRRSVEQLREEKLQLRQMELLLLQAHLGTSSPTNQ